MKEKYLKFWGFDKEPTIKMWIGKIIYLLFFCLVISFAMRGAVDYYTENVICDFTSFSILNNGSIGYYSLNIPLSDVKTYTNHSKGFNTNKIYLNDYQKITNCSITI